MLFKGQASHSPLSPLLSYPTEMLLQLYAQPLLPGTNMPFNLLVTLNALRLNLEYTKSQRGVDKGYLQSLLSVILLPCMSGVMSAILLQQTPGFMTSDTFLPTHFFVHLLLYFSPFLKSFLLSLPPILIDLPLIVSDSFLRTLAITSYGTELAIKSPYRGSWFTQIAAGGLSGSASAFTLATLNLWSPSGWRFTSENLSPVTWDMYGPFVLSTIHVALRGTHPVINNLSMFATAGVWGGKGTGFLNAEEARTAIALIFATVVILRRLGIYSFAFGSPTSGRTLGTTPLNDKKSR